MRFYTILMTKEACAASIDYCKIHLVTLAASYWEKALPTASIYLSACLFVYPALACKLKTEGRIIHTWCTRGITMLSVTDTVSYSYMSLMLRSKVKVTGQHVLRLRVCHHDL